MKYINKNCNFSKTQENWSKVSNCKSTNYQKQMNELNTVDHLCVSYDIGTAFIKLYVLTENQAKTDMELNINSATPAVPTTRF